MLRIFKKLDEYLNGLMQDVVYIIFFIILFSPTINNEVKKIIQAMDNKLFFEEILWTIFTKYLGEN